jgi:hypothetical protein
MSEQLNRLKQAQAARRENLAQFRAKQIQELPLPSGTVVFLKDVTMTDLMLTGKLPDIMLDMAQETASEGKSNIDLKNISKNGAEFKGLLDMLVRLCVVEPPIADVGDDEHLGIDEMNGDDKMAIFNFVNREVEQIKSFREGEDEPVAVVQPGNGIRAETKRVVRPKNGTRAVEPG